MDNGKSVSAAGFTCPEWSLKSFLQKPVSELYVLYQNSILHSFHHWSAELGPQTADQQGMLESLPELTGQIYPIKEGGEKGGEKKGKFLLKDEDQSQNTQPWSFPSYTISAKQTRQKDLPNYLVLRGTFEISVCS